MEYIKAVNDILAKLNHSLLNRNLLMAAFQSIVHNDEAHNVEHVRAVILLGDEICTRMEVDDQTRRMVLAGCLLHDLGCRYDRKTHHLISYGLAFEYLDKYGRGEYSEQDVMLVARACLEHRASYEGQPTHLVSELVALADRGNVTTEAYREYYITRSIQFHGCNTRYNLDAVKEEVLKHIPDKFGVNGYAWKTYPKIGFKVFGGAIEELKAFADNLAEVEKVIDRLFVKLNLV